MDIDKEWDWQIESHTSWWGSSLIELWEYRYLTVGLVRRDFLLIYQQTILGPLWVLLQPVLTMLTYVLVFGNVVGISTGDVPAVLFYFAGIVLWNLFNDAFLGIAATFRDNAQIFGKVYFPRLIIPISRLTGYFLHFGIQFGLLLLMLAWYVVFRGLPLPATSWLLFVPIAILLVGTISLALGLLFSVLTAKYRDITYLISMGVRLFMFITPIIYPLNRVPVQWRWVVQLNPLTPLFELFRRALLGQGTVQFSQLAYSGTFATILLLAALLLFNKQGDRLIDIL
ncbi:ABC transporter permease [Hymenobacter volaticus]|uniref:Transport permease protein n=1 Tax=Hymenobacter volaticus TaxID=2932254 RepID=A0ABY4GAD9_9BACT|nr:ABC transporter permease [Hymenobacter volaticus]UOQ67732.1 ABC transporter permease [Hymenobacter volaticus]